MARQARAPRIRNYLGFSRGLSGAELAQRAYQQAWVFGATFLLTREVVDIEVGDTMHTVSISGAPTVAAWSVILAMGVSDKRLDVPALAELEGSGVFYGSSPSEARQFTNGDVFVVGGANSAGQAAIHLARYAATSRSCAGVPSRRACRIPHRRDRREVEHPRSQRDGGRRRWR